MHREMKDELLFAMLFFGFRLFAVSLLVVNSIAFPSPNAGAEPIEAASFALSVTEVPPPSLLPGTKSAEFRFS